MCKLVDALYCKLHSEGLGCSVNQTETLADEDEEKLWQLDVLVNCVFFLNGKNFCQEGSLALLTTFLAKVLPVEKEYAIYEDTQLPQLFFVFVREGLGLVNRTANAFGMELAVQSIDQLAQSTVVTVGEKVDVDLLAFSNVPLYA